MFVENPAILTLGAYKPGPDMSQALLGFLRAPFDVCKDRMFSLKYVLFVAMHGKLWNEFVLSQEQEGSLNW